MDQNIMAMRLPDDMDYHLHLASAHHGLSRSEYVRLALAVALYAEPVVTPELARNMARMARNLKPAKRDLVDA